jgi:uncharacterized membrane protein
MKAGSEKVGALELTLSLVLRIGLAISIAIILVGMGLFFAGGDGKNGPQVLQTMMSRSGAWLAGFHDIIRGVSSFNPMAWISLGIFLLILTPTMRVGISFFLFWQQKDRVYMAITAIVFTLLTVSLVLGNTVL